MATANSLMYGSMVCSNGRPGAAWSCRFCHVPLHRGDDDCSCSEFREVTLMASLCGRCANAIDVLMADTTVGKVHRTLVYEANLRGRPTGDWRGE